MFNANFLNIFLCAIRYVYSPASNVYMYLMSWHALRPDLENVTNSRMARTNLLRVGENILVNRWSIINSFMPLESYLYCVCLVTIKKGANKTMKVKRPLWRQRNTFSARIKIMWKEQLVDPPIHYLTCVIVPWSLVKNKPVNPKAL